MHKHPSSYIKACLLCFATLSGCNQYDYTPPDQAPADFSLILCRQSAQQDNGIGSATFIVEPDGTLRAAIGPGCTLTTYPEPTARLDRQDIQAVYELASRAGLLHPPRSQATVSPPCFMAVTTADGQRVQTDQTLVIPIRIRPPQQTVYMDPEGKERIDRWDDLFNYLCQLSGLENEPH